MMCVNDTYFGQQYFDRCYRLFDQHSVLRRCESARIAVCSSDTAFCLALCLYVKARGGSVYPLPVDTPIDAARRRAERSGSQYLVYGADAEAALERIEAIELTANKGLDVHEPALIQTSSGTTGEPKYIARSWSSIDTEIESYVQHFDSSALTPIIACPVNHSYGLISGVLVALKRGVQPVVVTNPNPKYLLRKLTDTAASLLYCSPTLITTISLLTREDQPLFAVMTSGTLLQKKWFESVRKKVRHLHQQYGCSEAGCLTLGQDIGTASELGNPLPHVELIASGSVSDPQEILARLRGGKTVATRDLGYLDGGKLHFVSRLDDMINVAGFNVYPSEVEEAVLEMSEVTDAVAFKRSHDFGNEQVCLQFVSKQPISHSRIREWCAKKLATHQVPMSIAQVESIPRLPNGKVSRKALADAADRRQASSSSARELLS
jgi:fatty-acyl-CoA synthase